jgi:hypothetical protein
MKRIALKNENGDFGGWFDLERATDMGSNRAPVNREWETVNSENRSEPVTYAERPENPNVEDDIADAADVYGTDSANLNDTDPGEHAIIQGYAELQERAEQELAEFEASPELQEEFKNNPYYRGPALLWTGLPDQPGDLYDPSKGDFTQGVADAVMGEPRPLPSPENGEQCVER